MVKFSDFLPFRLIFRPIPTLDGGSLGKLNKDGYLCAAKQKTGMTDQQKMLTGHLACFVAYAIFGINIIVCKDLTRGQLISPIALFCLRSIGAGALFWLISLFLPREKVDRRDFPRIFAASIFGFFLTQVTFLMAISDITPVNCSVISAMSPIYTMFIAAFALKEPVTAKKAGGVLLSFAGIIYLILNSVSATNGVAESKPAGIFLIFMNSLCFSIYLGVFKPLIAKYSVITFMKWIFLFSTLFSLPMAGREILNTDFTSLPASFVWELSFLIVFATFVTYSLIPVGQKFIRPTLVSMYSYVQPIIAIVISILIGMDSLSLKKILAIATVFTGVVIVSFSRRAHTDTRQ